MKSLIYSTIITSMLFGCSSPSCDELFTTSIFQFNKTYCAGTNDAEVRLVDIQDSRCPDDVVCVWEGQVRLKLELKNSKGTIQDSITFANNNKSQSFSNVLGKYLINIQSIAPYPTSSNIPIQISDYRINMKVREE